MSLRNNLVRNSLETFVYLQHLHKINVVNTLLTQTVVWLHHLHDDKIVFQTYNGFNIYKQVWNAYNYLTLRNIIH